MQELVRLERVGVDDLTAAQIVPKSGEVGAVNTRIQEVSVVLIQQEFEPNGLVRWHPVALAIADPQSEAGFCLLTANAVDPACCAKRSAAAPSASGSLARMASLPGTTASPKYASAYCGSPVNVMWSSFMWRRDRWGARRRPTPMPI